MNELVIAYNGTSGKYSLHVVSGFLTDRIRYDTYKGLWVKLDSEGKYKRVDAFNGDNRVVTLQEYECTKKTWKAIMSLTKVLESCFND